MRASQPAKAERTLPKTRRSRLAVRLIQTNHRQIACRIVANHSRWHTPPVRQRYRDAHSVMHHVAIGEDQPIRREHESRPAALPFARLP